MQHELEEFLFRTLYRDPRVVENTGKAKALVKDLFEVYASDPDRLPDAYRLWAEEVGLHRAICDYVAGMTDRYAQDQHRLLLRTHRRM
jgi:dGTPase